MLFQLLASAALSPKLLNYLCFKIREVGLKKKVSQEEELLIPVINKG